MDLPPSKQAQVAINMINAMQAEGLSYLDLMNITAIMQHIAARECDITTPELITSVANRLTTLSKLPG